jgi:hypothetical protein
MVKRAHHLLYSKGALDQCANDLVAIGVVHLIGPHLCGPIFSRGKPQVDSENIPVSLALSICEGSNSLMFRFVYC